MQFPARKIAPTRILPPRAALTGNPGDVESRSDLSQLVAINRDCSAGEGGEALRSGISTWELSSDRQGQACNLQKVLSFCPVVGWWRRVRRGAQLAERLVSAMFVAKMALRADQRRRGISRMASPCQQISGGREARPSMLRDAVRTTAARPQRAGTAAYWAVWGVVTAAI